MDKKSFFPTNLNYLRRSRNMTQTQLAEKISVDQTTIGRWEDGNREPTIGNVVNLSKIFNVTITDLLEKDLRAEDYFFDNDEELCKDLILSTTDFLDEFTQNLIYKCFKLSKENQKKIDEIIDLYLMQEENSPERIENKKYDEKYFNMKNQNENK